MIDFWKIVEFITISQGLNTKSNSLYPLGKVDKNKTLNPPLNFQPFNQGQSISLTMISYEDHQFLKPFIFKILLHHTDLPSHCVTVELSRLSHRNTHDIHQLTRELLEFLFLYWKKIEWYQNGGPLAIYLFCNFCNQSEYQRKLIEASALDTNLSSCAETFFNMLISSSDSIP